ncbi:MAG: hypothetical protein IJW06_07760 [Clostridia bacterium]|nr:hypothetical protein [Clostridia bacterium]
MKRIFAIVLAAMLAVTLISCKVKNDTEGVDEKTENKTDVVEIYNDVDLAAVADSLYNGIAEDERPFVMSMTLTSEDFEFFTFIPYEEGLEAVANEPMMSSIAHSIVLVKAPTAEKAEEIAAAMKENCDPRKWMCVEADIVEGVTNGNIAMLLMTTTEGGMADTILNNFASLDAEKIATLKSDTFVGIEDDEIIEDEFADAEVETDAEDVVVELPGVDVDDAPAAGFEEENVPAVMPEVTPEATPEVEKTPEADKRVPSDVTIDTLYEIADKLYKGIDPENMPMMGTLQLDSESFEYSAFVPFKTTYLAVESMPMMGSTPHSVVIVKADSEAEAAQLAEDMKANANPRKWICVNARSVKSAHKGEFAILVMTSVEVMPTDKISEEKAETMSNEQSEERANLIINNFLAAVK